MSAVETSLPLIKQFEGYAKRLANDWVVAYQDVVGVWTIGYGSTGPNIKQGTYWTREQAESDLLSRVTELAAQITTASPVLSQPENENRLAAVISFAYNLGIGAYRASTLKRKVDVQDWEASAQEFSKWVLAGGKRVPGLVTRRAKEAALFQTPVTDQASSPSLQVQEAQQTAELSILARFVSWLLSKFKR